MPKDKEIRIASKKSLNFIRTYRRPSAMESFESKFKKSGIELMDRTFRE